MQEQFPGQTAENQHFSFNVARYSKKNVLAVIPKKFPKLPIANVQETEI